MGQRLWQSGYRLPAWAVALLWAVMATISLAQEPSAPAESKPGEAPSAKPIAGPTLPGEALPQIYYLKDKNGNLQATLGMTYEQFMELYRLKNQLDEQNERPSYSIENLTLSGSAVGQRARARRLSALFSACRSGSVLAARGRNREQSDPSVPRSLSGAMAIVPGAALENARGHPRRDRPRRLTPVP